MSPYRKNIMVGIVVLGGLVVLGWMILQFGDAPIRMFATEQVRVTFVTDRAEGLSEGSAVVFRGVTVGKINAIERQADHQTVRIEALVDTQPPLPENVIAHIRSTGLIGSGATVSLLVPPGDQPRGQLGEGQEIKTTFVGLDLLPPEFAELAEEMKLTARQFRESNLVGDLDEAVKEATVTIRSVNEIVGDEEIKTNLKQSLKNITAATETANKIAGNLETFSKDLEAVGNETTITIKKAQGAIDKASGTIEKVGGHVDDLDKQIDERMLEVAKLLASFQSIARKIDEGKGTAGAFINDKRLYESLVLTSEQLNAMMKDLNRLVEQWEQEGATLRLR
jgi:phospholipid/cholesterol/gamma-HCH transport system substrate-binding protein